MMAAESIYIMEPDRYFSQSIIKSNRSSSLCLRDGASCEKGEVEFCNIESFSLTEQTPGFPVEKVCHLLSIILSSYNLLELCFDHDIEFYKIFPINYK